MKTRLLGLLPLIALVVALAITGGYVALTEAASVPWYHGVVTAHYGKNAEHGVDIVTNYKAITALLPGRVTGVYLENWEWPRPEVITWKLDHAVCYRGHCAAFMYVQIRNSALRIGEHIKAGQMLGWSGAFIELGFCNVPAYGHIGYVWLYSGIDPLRIWPYL